MKILKVKCLAPTRLDNYLMQQFPALNPGRLNKALRENKIKLNGKKQPLSTRVMAGDEIKLQRAWLEHTLELAFSRLICCSLAWWSAHTLSCRPHPLSLPRFCPEAFFPWLM